MIKKVNTEWLGSTHGHFGEDRELLVIWKKVFSRRLKGFELSPRHRMTRVRKLYKLRFDMISMHVARVRH